MSISLSEYAAKKIYYGTSARVHRLVRENTQILLGYEELAGDPELRGARWVIKVDQQVKGRMKKGLVGLDLRLDDLTDWVAQRDPVYRSFILEPMVPQVQLEAYLLIQNVGEKIEIAFTFQGGINVDAQRTQKISFEERPSTNDLRQLFVGLNDEKLIQAWSSSVQDIWTFYDNYHLTFLEINPLAWLSDGTVRPLDMLAKCDPAAVYLWPTEARKLIDQSDTSKRTPEEKYIQELGEKTGASLKFTLLEPNSRVWFLLFGGGASVCYFDKQTRASLEWPDLKPANYGELSGNPTREFVREYVSSIISLMRQSKAEPPLNLVIGGGIANFTDVKVTFQGIVDALTLSIDFLLAKPVYLVVRRGGPGYLEGLTILREFCERTGLSAEIHGPEYPMTKILDRVNNITGPIVYPITSVDPPVRVYSSHGPLTHLPCFETKCFILGSQIGVAQNMLDYDYLIGKKEPSVAGLIDPTKRKKINVPVHWGKVCLLLPIYPSLSEALASHPEVSAVINFASYRSAYDTTMDALNQPAIQFVSVLAEGIPEKYAKKMIRHARSLGKTILGPSTVGAIIPGAFRVGNAGGRIEAVLESGLDQPCTPENPGIGLVTRSGGLLNELCHMIHKQGGRVAAAIAVGGDRYLGTGFGQVIRLYQSMPNVSRIVCLGEMGGQQEIEVADLVSSGEVTKPVCALCLGVAAEHQGDRTITFGHSGSEMLSLTESSTYKNSFMAASGITVPKSWEDLENLLFTGSILSETRAEVFWKDREVPSIFSSISDERGSELTYNRVPVSSVESIGQAIGLLWFKKSLPDSLAKYIERILVVCADHGPAVSGAQNTIITTRAGKDLMSSLASGLLTVGPRFGGAINEAARSFYYAWKDGVSPTDFVKSSGIISGIGHRHYTFHNPDSRIVMLEPLFQAICQQRSVTGYARSVEKLTLLKRSNLILNVDGFIATSLIDCFLSSVFTQTEVEELLGQEIFNAFFALARTIGFIGHHIDQKRLGQELYRAPSTSIGYL